MNLKILSALAVIAVVLAISITATLAFFRDTEQNTTNTFTVGTLDLDVSGKNGESIDEFNIANMGSTATLSGTNTWTINNEGSLPGRLYFKLNNVLNYEDDCNEPEAIVDTSCNVTGAPDDGVGLGELGDVITMNIYVDDTLIATSDMSTANQDVIGDTFYALDPAIVIPAESSVQFRMEWATDEDGYDNSIQSDYLTFGIQFDLIQLETTLPTAL